MNTSQLQVFAPNDFLIIIHCDNICCFSGGLQLSLEGDNLIANAESGNGVYVMPTQVIAAQPTHIKVTRCESIRVLVRNTKGVDLVCLPVAAPQAHVCHALVRLAQEAWTQPAGPKEVMVSPTPDPTPDSYLDLPLFS